MLPHQVAAHIAVVPSTGLLPADDVHKPDGEYWVVIPGAVEFNRKDIDILLDADFYRSIPSNVRFIFLGNAGGVSDELVRFRILAESLSERILYFNEYVDHQTYSNYMHNADLVLPLIHPRCSEYSHFFTSKTSGAVCGAQAVGKPIAFEKGFSIFTDLHLHNRFYDVDELSVKIAEWSRTPAVTTYSFEDTVVQRLESTRRVLDKNS